MKDLPGRGALAALLAVALPAALLAVASLPWHAERPPSPPRVVRAGEGLGALRAGAAMVPFDLPPDVPIAGFARLSYRSEGAEPVGARALVVEAPGLKLALVSAELLVVPAALEAAVAARVGDLGLGGLVIAATHTHAGPGGFWRHPLGERLAAGSFDPRVEAALASGIAEAIRRAAAALGPARVSVARDEAPELVRSRSRGAEDARLTAVRVDRPGGDPIAEVVVFAAHPTLLGKANRRISGDWPGRLMASGARGVRLFFEGPVGDQSVDGPTGTPETYARALAARVDALRADPAPDAALAYAAVEVSLPAPSPGAAPPLLRRAAGNLVHGSYPATTEVEAVRLGDALLVTTPAEPVAAVAAAWRAALPPGATLVSLSGDYVGYVEAPERMERREGETVRTQFGPDLAVRLGEAAMLAAERVTRTPAAAAASRR